MVNFGPQMADSKCMNGAYMARRAAIKLQLPPLFYVYSFNCEIKSFCSEWISMFYQQQPVIINC